MQRARDELFSASGFAGDEHGAGVGREPADEDEELLHDRSAANHAAEFRVHRDLLLRLQQPAPARLVVAQRREQMIQPLEIERFRQVVDGAELDGFDRAIDRGVATHQNDLTVGIGRAYRAQDFDATDIGQAQIDDGDVGSMIYQLIERVFAICARDDVEARYLRKPGDEIQHRRFVVDDEDGRT